ncbi:hypothetical protein SLEP1_g14459 [Rubroshorea leprosula]|uniref:Uncharacterized protein n=1 Tax=Rubroshorea leprosula TaxID=152421 RepID=A0AAV5ITP1_9ROSI|nr:hypothetical protein SLEP1_g14459 [Rubroshorea leprosula]
MENQGVLTQEPKSLSLSGSGRRSCDSYSSSTEFEFWMVRNPSCPQPDLLSADELFVNGVLLPLDLLPTKQPDPNPPPDSDPSSSQPAGPGLEPERYPDSERGSRLISDPVTAISASKRWRDIFKKDKGKGGTTKKHEVEEGEKGKEKKKEKKSQSQSQSGVNPAELNINIWPFSRSRSAGNSGTRPKMSGSLLNRKVSSAPCSRSNSAGESNMRVKWPSSPGRTGVHLGRSSPVWQVRRGGSGLKSFDGLIRNREKGHGSGINEVTESRRSKNIGNGGKARVLNLNVPMCIGTRHNLSCRSDENGAVDVGTRTDNSCSSSGSNGQPTTVGGGGTGSLFNLRNLFTKKVY